MSYVGVLNSVEEEILTNQDVEYYVTNGGEIYSIDGSTRTLMFDGTDWIGGELVLPEEYADAITNFVWSDVSGVHISTEKDDATTSGVKNVLLDSDGLKVRNGETELASFGDEEIILGQQSHRARICIQGNASYLQSIYMGDDEATYKPIYDFYMVARAGCLVLVGYDDETSRTTGLTLDKRAIEFDISAYDDDRVIEAMKLNGRPITDYLVQVGHVNKTVTVTHNSRSATLTLRRAGNVVTASMHGVFAVTSRNALVTMSGTVPTGYRPIDDQYISVANVASNAVSDQSRWLFGSDGTIKVTTNAPANTLREYYIDATWITSENMPS